MERIPRKYLYAVISAWVSLLAPLGWFVMSQAVDAPLTPTAVYLYIGLGSFGSFSVFGFLLGHFVQKLRETSDEDFLTGLLNQRAFMHASRSLMQLAIREKTQLAILMIDIDHFKQVNDKFNHLFGSQVIKDIGLMLKTNVRQSDVVARFGGDEFVLCLPKTGEDHAALVADRIRMMIEGTTFRWKDLSVKVTISIGIAEMQSLSETDLLRLVEKADSTLYVAKNNGRNQVRLASEKASA